MKRPSHVILCVALITPLLAVAQTTPAPPGAQNTTPKPGYEDKKTTESGQSTTYPKSSVQPAPSGTVDKRMEITKGDGKTPSSAAKPLDEPATSDKPAKSGSQSGATTK